MSFDENDFEDFIPDGNSAKAKSVFMSAYHPAKSDKTVIFRVWIGKAVLEQLIDADGRSWFNDAVQRVSIRIGQGEKKGQMLIAASRGGNIDLRKGRGDNPNGRSISVKNFPGIAPMEVHEVKWAIVNGSVGQSLHITEYKTGDFTIDQIKKSEAAIITEPKPVVKDETPRKIETATLTPPPPPKEHYKPSKAEAYEAMSKVGKKK